MSPKEAFDNIKRSMLYTHVLNLEDVICVKKALDELDEIKSRAETVIKNTEFGDDWVVRSDIAIILKYILKGD